MAEGPLSTHTRLYKNADKGCEEMRRRRSDVTVELRKAKKNGQVDKRRNIDQKEEDLDLLQGRGEGEDCPPQFGNGQGQTSLLGDKGQVPVSFETLETINECISSSDQHQVFTGCQMIRKILSRSLDPPIDSVIDSGLVPKCIELLGSPDHKTQLEAAWIATNIAAGNGTQTRWLTTQGVIGPMIELLQSKYLAIIHQAVWALGNLAGDSAWLRDMVIKEGAVPALVGAASKPDLTIEFQRTLAWTLANLCRGKPSPPPEAVRQMLPILAYLIKLDDAVVVSDAAWGIAYTSGGRNEQIEEVLNANVVPRIVELLQLPLLPADDNKILLPCLRAIANIVSGTDEQVDRVLEIQTRLLQTLATLLQCPVRAISMEAGWALTNITAGALRHASAVIDAGLVPVFVRVIQGEADLKTKEEAVHSLASIAKIANIDIVAHLFKFETIPAFCSVFKSLASGETVLAALEGLENMLKCAAVAGPITLLSPMLEQIEERLGLDRLESMQFDRNAQIAEKATHILDKYYGIGEKNAAALEATQMEFALPPTAPAPATAEKDENHNTAFRHDSDWQF